MKKIKVPEAGAKGGPRGLEVREPAPDCSPGAVDRAACRSLQVSSLASPDG